MNERRYAMGNERPRYAIGNPKPKPKPEPKPKPPKQRVSKNKMRPTITIALRDRITDIVETRTPDAKEMSFEEKARYLKMIMQNFKNNFYDQHPNREKYCESNNLGGEHSTETDFYKHIGSGGLFREFERLEAALAELDGEVA